MAGCQWSWDWINAIDLGEDKLELYPLQLANCRRLERHDAVYLFDEVGCGKTISAGLMALHYLWNRPGRDVLVITTNTLVVNHQFIGDWEKKLPLLRRDSRLGKRIQCRNNLYTGISSIPDEDKDKIGLVILDEAHEFLDSTNRRYKTLTGEWPTRERPEIRGISAEKVIFLTATPIKGNPQRDLRAYAALAQKITGSKTLQDDWIKELIPTGGQNTALYEPKRLICSRFALHLPVTRYFKDTVAALQMETSHLDKKARRLLADTWEYKGDDRRKDGRVNKIKTLFDKVDEILKGRAEENPLIPNRFVVFAHYLEEIEAIKAYFTEHGYESYDKNLSDSGKTIKTVTGVNSGELKKFGRLDGRQLPTVLVVNYQIGESGVNLPGFNHIVNYNISEFPARLEQRFGRIDRMDSLFDEIETHYLVTTDVWRDCNTGNFHDAMASYIENLLVCLPSKNALLSQSILKYHRERRAETRKQMEEAAKAIETINHPDNLREWIRSWKKHLEKTPDFQKGRFSYFGRRYYYSAVDIEDDTELAETTWKALDMLLYKYRTRIDTDEIGIPLFDLEKLKDVDPDKLSFDTLKLLEEAVSMALEQQEKRWKAYDSGTKADRLEKAGKIAEFYEAQGDKIFFAYRDDEMENMQTELQPVDAICDEKGGCALWISESDAYQDFKQELMMILLPG